MRYCLFDMSNLLYRVMHMNGDNDEDTVRSACLMVSLNSIKKVYNTFQPDHIIACFDHGTPWRELFFPPYKKQRKQSQTRREKEIRQAVYKAADILHEFLDKNTKVTVLRENGIEADDFISRWVQLHDNDENIIISTDGDFIQLLNDKVFLYNGVQDHITHSTGIFCRTNIQELKMPRVQLFNQEWKQKLIIDGKNVTDTPITIEPDWELFFKIAKGDKSDNIPPAHIPYFKTKKIRDAFDYPNGESWVEMMMGIKQKTIDPDTGEETLVLVKDHFERNRKLIDMKAIDPKVVDTMDKHLEYKMVNQKLSMAVGLALGKLCHVYNLNRIGQSPESFKTILSKGYN